MHEMDVAAMCFFHYIDLKLTATTTHEEIKLRTVSTGDLYTHNNKKTVCHVPLGRVKSIKLITYDKIMTDNSKEKIRKNEKYITLKDMLMS